MALSPDNVLSLDLACPALAKSKLGTVVRELQNGVGVDTAHQSGHPAPGLTFTHRFPTANTSAGILADVASIGSTDGTIHLLPGTWTINAATDIPTNVRLVPEQGAMFTKSGSGTLTINGPFDAPLTQVFSGFAAGEVTFTGITKVHPEWWGAKTSSDDTLAIQSACAAFAGKGGEIRYSGTTPYHITGTVEVPEYVRMIGEARANWQPDKATVILHEPPNPGGANSVDCFRVTNVGVPGYYAPVEFSHLSIVGNDYSRRGIDFHYGHVRVHNVGARHFDVGFYLQGMIHSVFDQCILSECREFSVDFDPETMVSTTVIFKSTYFSGGGVTPTLVRIRNCVEILFEGRCVFESPLGDAIAAEGVSITLLSPYFENIAGSFLKAGQETLCYVTVVGGDYISIIDHTEDNFYFDNVRMATLIGLSPLMFDRASVVRTTANTGFLKAEIPANSIVVASTGDRTDETEYSKGTKIGVVCDEDSVRRVFVCTVSGTTAAAQPEGFTAYARDVIDGTAHFRSVAPACIANWSRASLTKQSSATVSAAQKIIGQILLKADAETEWHLQSGHLYNPGDFTISSHRDSGDQLILYAASGTPKIGIQGGDCSATKGAQANLGLQVVQGLLADSVSCTGSLDTVQLVVGTTRIASSAAAPATGTWSKGDVVFNTNPSAGGWAGWICTVAGEPGTWKGFGAIESP